MKNFRNIWKHSMMVGLAAITLASGSSMIRIDNVQAKAIPQIFDLESHRGGRDARPENTLVSFAYALELGVTTLEMDMQMTKDGHIVISHNPYMNHNLAKDANGTYVKNGMYDIRTMTLAQVKQFDVGTMNPEAGDYYAGHGKTQLSVPGTKMPTLEEVFELVNDYGNDKVLFNIETKSYPDPAFPEAKNSPDPAAFVAKFYEIVKKYHMEERVMLQSFDWRTLQEMKKLDPNITRVALTCEQPTWGRDSVCRQVGEPGASPWMAGLDIDVYKGDYIKAAKAIGADVVSPYWEELSNEMVSEAHELGMKVVPWTVNNPDKMNMLIDMGVDGIITDKPWVLRELLIKRGIAVAEPTININSPYHTGIGIAGVETEKLCKGGDSAE
ncbi:glycerophosphodiester phosphodiesterase [Sporomusa acidovorans]|uniref:GP-PDE domain-containing protein n=1 Tax=Sporomusa acidovorans (strain ATCC 49682 / DSM 3132 / Mol) TaxID=1123286 RepID=A0ABZ3J5T2_SPOA4|nr:glycerophosphodiester phosphodiesterase [Sporomusa acidovorans]OZC15108.1 glycerophosphoryl diester phosphodiesterase [Sporomusa acidovorans DSM 3132]SDF82434.1 glycerophosphoryl diester phosphodiesterase [Sporomusa acidovorans]